MSQKNWPIIALCAVGLSGAIVITVQTVKGPSGPKSALPNSAAGAATTSGTASVAADTSTWQTYENKDYGFALTYPPDFSIQTRSSTDPSYDIELRFAVGTSTVPLALQVTDLARYLPLTTTPELSAYIQTLSGLDGFREATIGDKHAYEYLICGQAACSQEVVFIESNRQYEFSIEYRAYVPPGLPSTSKNAISFENAPPIVQQVIKSLRFLQHQ